jgi:hypothetical protein
MEWQGAGDGMPVDVRYSVVGPLAGASGRGAVAGAVLPEAACGEPDDVGVYRDLDGGVAGPAVWPAGAGAEHAGQGLFPDAGSELLQALPLARYPDAGAQGLVDGTGSGADSGVHVLPLVVAQLGKVAAPAWVRAAGPIQSRWRRQMVRCGGRRQATGPAMPRRAMQRRQAGRSS